ncbi:MAG: A24 family peptidase [Thermoactinomyces sp.]
MAEKALLMIVASGFLGYWVPDLARWIGIKKLTKPRLPSVCSKAFCKTFMCGVSAGLAWGVYLRVGTGLEGWMAIVLIWLLLMIVLTDMWFFIIPNLITYNGFLLFMLIRFFLDRMPVGNYLLAVVSITFVLAFISRISNALGWGDVKLMAMAAWVIGWPHVFLALWLASASSLIYAAGRVKSQGWKSLKYPIPFGPHLALGIVSVLLGGDFLWAKIWEMVE